MNRGTVVPASVVRDAITAYFHPDRVDYQVLAEKLGCDANVFSRLWRQETVTLGKADRILVALGDTYLLAPYLEAVAS